MGIKKIVLLCAAVSLFLTACSGGRSYVTDEEVPELDSYTMSLSFDRKDLDRLYKENMDAMLKSSIVKQWERQSIQNNRPIVAIFPMRNETSEHLGTQLDALLSQFETDLVNKSPVRVVSHENQPDLMAEVRRQQSVEYDPKNLARFGKQLGAQFFVTGKVYDVSNRVKDERRVQYFMFVQVIEVETGEIRFQNKAKLTKALVR